MSAVTGRLVLPYENNSEWERITSILQRNYDSLTVLDDILNEFAVSSRKCQFFTRITAREDAITFDFNEFLTSGVPLLVRVALELPRLFAGETIPLLLEGDNKSVSLTRRQCACLLAHSFFGSITERAILQGSSKLWSFNVSELFFLESVPSALCFLNYFKVMGQEFQDSHEKFWNEQVVFERFGFSRRNGPPWKWENNPKALVPVQFASSTDRIEDSVADTHVDFANRFVGGGCTTGDTHMEEILFLIKPELMVARVLSSHMQDEEAIRIHGALQFSTYDGFASTFKFIGDYEGFHNGSPPTVLAMDALQMNKVQFKCIRRDLDKARLAFAGAGKVATGNWGCGAFGNDYVLKFLQQWMAASDAGLSELVYHTFGQRKAEALPRIAASFKNMNVGELWNLVRDASDIASNVFPPPMQKIEFLKQINSAMKLL